MRTSTAIEEQKIQQNNAAEAVAMPVMIQRRAATLANGMGVPVTHYAGDDFDYLSILDVAPQFPDDDFTPARWSISLTSHGSWIVADTGRWDYLEIHVEPSAVSFRTLAEALAAVREARAAALMASV